MRTLTERQIRSCFVNCSQGDVRRMSLPTNFTELDWAGLSYLGWLDPKSPTRGYIVVERDDEVIGIAVRTPQSQTGGGVAQQCSLCLTTHTGNGVTLMVARRAGAAGRNGNTFGTYICSDLACSDYLRGTRRPVGVARQMGETLSLADRVVRSRVKVNAFVDAVREDELTVTGH